MGRLVARHCRARLGLALLAATLVTACAVAPEAAPPPAAPDRPPPAAPERPPPAAPDRPAAVDSTAPAAVDSTTPAAVVSTAPAAVDPAAPATPERRITAEGWILDMDALGARPPGERAAAIGSRVVALEVLAGEVRAAAAQARLRDPDAADLRAVIGDVARLVDTTRGVLMTLAAQERTLAEGLARIEQDQRAARARRDSAVAQRARPISDPVYPDLPLEQARAAIERDLRRLAEERAALAEEVASSLDTPTVAAEAPLVAREAERLAAAVPEALARAGAAAPGGLSRVAQGLVLTTRAVVTGSRRTRDGLQELARREREVARLLEEAASLELERRRARLDEVNRQVLDRARREEETERLARREQELNAQIDRLQRALARAETRAQEEEAEIAAVRSRAQALAAAGDDPALRSYQATLEDHDRRLEAARKRRDASRADLEALQGTITTERDTRAALAMTLRDEVEAAHRAWEQDRDPRPLEVLERSLEQAVLEARAAAARLAERGAEVSRLAEEAESLAEQSATEGERRAVYMGSAPASHRPALSAIEEVRALIESTRREEARQRRGLSRGLEAARRRAEQDLAALTQDLQEVAAARKATVEARKLNTGALRTSAGELRALLAQQRLAWSARLEAWRGSSDGAQRREAGRLAAAAALAAALLLVGWRVRRRAHTRVAHLLTTKVDPTRRVIVEPAARWAFYAAYVLRDAAPWATLVAACACAGAMLDLPRGLIGRASAAAGALLFTRVLALLNHLLFRDRLIRSVVPLAEENKRPLNTRLRLALAALGPLLAAYLLVRGLPELWATAVVLRASLSVLVVLTLISILHVARHDVARLLRVEVAPPEADGRVQAIEWLKGLYNRVVDDLLALVLLDVLAMGTLWVGGYVEQAAFLLRGTVQTALTVAAALVLVGALRKLNRRIMGGALGDETARPGMQIVVSMAAFVGSRLSELGLLGLVGLSLFDAWGGSIAPVLEFVVSERFLAGLGAAAKIVVICAVAYYANRLALFTIDTFVEQTLRSANPEVARRRDTFAPLAKSFIRYALLLTAIVYSATHAGVDIMSILAGLGVVGLAVAFGAQTLVKDVISGFFVIMEDELAVGDWVKIGAHEGTVEHVGVRTTKLRTVNGVLISIPNGTIDQVHNFNRGWNRAIVDIEVTYDANVEKAMAVLLEVAEEYRRQRPDLMLEPTEVQGILRYGVSGITLRLRAKTAPLAVWQVERELRLRSLVAFEDQGIEIPLSRHVVMLKSEGSDGRLQSVDLASLLRPPAAPPAPAPGADAARAAEAGADSPRRTVTLARDDVRAALAAVAAASPQTAAPQAAAPQTAASQTAAPQTAAPPHLPAAAPAASDDPAMVPAFGSPPDAADSSETVGLPEWAEVAARGAAVAEPVAPVAPVEARPTRTRRLVLSEEARARLADDAYVRSVTAEEPAIPAEMQASLEAIQQHRQVAEAARQASIPSTAAAPDDTAPDDTAPDDTAPDDTAPDDTANDDTANDDTANDDTANGVTEAPDFQGQDTQVDDVPPPVGEAPVGEAPVGEAPVGEAPPPADARAAPVEVAQDPAADPGRSAARAPQGSVTDSVSDSGRTEVVNVALDPDLDPGLDPDLDPDDAGAGRVARARPRPGDAPPPATGS